MMQRAWVATRKGLFQLQRGDAGWRIDAVSFLGEPVSAILPPDPSDPGRPMIAALNLGHFGVKCHASQDGGRSWQEVSAPQYPPQPPDSQGDVPWKLVQVWSLAARRGTLWAGTLPGGLFRSDDGGRSWGLVEALWQQDARKEWFGGGYDVPGIHSIVLDPRDDDPQRQRILVGISCGGVWASDDGGRSWHLSARGMRAAYMPPEQADNPNIQDPHRIVACRASPDRLWCQHHNGIWRSDDAGANWQPLTDVPVSAFGFAVAVDPNDPDRAWFVPAVADERRVPVDGAFAVLRTDDGGRSFTALRSGLPQTHCYDLVYRHGLDVSADGRTLMLGSTTGGLWASDDAGAHWTTVSMSLPPIHAVALSP